MSVMVKNGSYINSLKLYKSVSNIKTKSFHVVNERAKCTKHPNINRVSFYNDLVLTLFVLGGGG